MLEQEEEQGQMLMQMLRQYLHQQSREAKEGREEVLRRLKLGEGEPLNEWELQWLMLMFMSSGKRLDEKEELELEELKQKLVQKKQKLVQKKQKRVREELKQSMISRASFKIILYLTPSSRRQPLENAFGDFIEESLSATSTIERLKLLAQYLLRAVFVLYPIALFRFFFMKKEGDKSSDRLT